ncbi:MAG: DUF3604 domain-containing protein [Acidobacteriota bacterium]
MTNRTISTAAAAVLAAALLVVTATRRGDAQLPPELATVGEPAMVSVPEAGNPVNNGYPSLLQTRNGTLWCAWISARQRDPEVKVQNAPYEEGDMVILRSRTAGKWGRAIRLNTNFGVNHMPELGEDANGNTIAVWSSRRDMEDGIWWRRVSADMLPGSELRVPPAGRLEAFPRMTRTADGTLWLAFQSFKNGSADIVFYRLSGSGWQRMEDAAATPDHEYRPRLAAAPDGAVWATWDVYSKGKYRVMLRRFDPRGGGWSAPEEAPGAKALDAYAPDLAVDASGRVWLTYARNEVVDHDWGLRGAKNGASPRPTTRLVVHESAGWSYPRPLSGEEPGMVAIGDLPRVAVEPSGVVWVLWNMLPGHVDWKVGAAVYGDGRWQASHVFGKEEPVALDGPPRRADQRPSLIFLANGGAEFAYERGRGAFRNRDIYTREVKLRAQPGAGSPQLTRFANEDLQPVERAARVAPKRLAIHSTTGERRQLFFGDLHNHIQVDDGHEGSVDQLFTIHRDRFGSDFAATTSHGDSNKLLLSELAHNDLGTETLNTPGRFVTIPGFEWTQGDYVIPRAGHRHVIYETAGGPLYRPTEGTSDSIREFTDLMSKTNGLLFAHHVSRASAGGTDWSYTNIRVEPAVEMASSWGRFEYYQNPGHIRVPELKNSSVQDAWRMGWRLGVIGGSDGHNLFGDRIQGLTGIYATELTRPALFEAIRKRRCYATTGEPITVDFRVNGQLMGSEIAATDGPVVEGAVEGTAKLISVEVVKFSGGQYQTVYRAPLDANKSKVWWRDPQFTGDAFYYLRVTQEASPGIQRRYSSMQPNPFPSEMAWSSPVWVSKQ